MKGLTREQLIAYYVVRLHYIGIRKQSQKVLDKCKEILEQVDQTDPNNSQQTNKEKSNDQPKSISS